MPPVKPERVAETNNCTYAKRRGFEVRKMNGLGKRSWPDRMFIGPLTIFFIEYKVVGEDPTPGQQEMINKLRRWGHHVYVVDDPRIGRTIIDFELAHPNEPGGWMGKGGSNA